MTRRPPPQYPQRQQGAALLLAMLTVALVATLCAAAYWRQWRDWQVERLEQQHTQAAWVLTGALDWARLILREDARASRVDHLAEPWAVPLQETRLSNFLSTADHSDTDLMQTAFLTGRVIDLQGKLNLRNLLDMDEQRPQVSRIDLAAFENLFASLGLPPSELQALVRGLTQAYAPGDATPLAPLRPQRFEQLAWLGLSSASLQALAPHATWLPERTQLNLNTASAQALSASLPSLDLAQAQTLVAQRNRQYFNNLGEVAEQNTSVAGELSPQRHAVSSRYFEVHGSLRLEDTWIEETSWLVRDGIKVRVLWREHRGAPDGQLQALQ